LSQKLKLFNTLISYEQFAVSVTTNLSNYISSTFYPTADQLPSNYPRRHFTVLRLCYIKSSGFC